jgi:hypothetical protein
MIFAALIFTPIFDRYHQRVYDLNRLVAVSVDRSRFRISLSDYSDNQLSSVDSKALLDSAALYQENPFFPYFEEKLRPVIEGWDHPWIGISLCYLNQALVSFALAGWIRDNFPGKILVMGGGLISSWMSRPDFNNPFSSLVDHLVKGEGESPLLALLGKPGIEKNIMCRITGLPITMITLRRQKFCLFGVPSGVTGASAGSALKRLKHVPIQPSGPIGCLETLT